MMIPYTVCQKVDVFQYLGINSLPSLLFGCSTPLFFLPMTTETVIVCVCRTPLTRATKHKTHTTSSLIATVVKNSLIRSNLIADYHSIGDVCFGNVLGGTAFPVTLRVGVVEGIKQASPNKRSLSSLYSLPVRAVNRQCASGLQAIM